MIHEHTRSKPKHTTQTTKDALVPTSAVTRCCRKNVCERFRPQTFECQATILAAAQLSPTRRRIPSGGNQHMHSCILDGRWVNQDSADQQVADHSPVQHSSQGRLQTQTVCAHQTTKSPGFRSSLSQLHANFKHWHRADSLKGERIPRPWHVPCTFSASFTLPVDSVLQQLGLCDDMMRLPCQPTAGFTTKRLHGVGKGRSKRFMPLPLVMFRRTAFPGVEILPLFS